MPQKNIPETLTFDDVLLLPGRSRVLPRDADTTTLFSRNIKLRIPIVSAAMDTVTEARLAMPPLDDPPHRTPTALPARPHTGRPPTERPHQ